ncbi:cellulase family glycosylhydrolase [Williamsia sp. M5A3_1d]
MRRRILSSVRMSRLELTVLVVLAAMVCAFTSVAFLAKSETHYSSIEVAAIKQVSTTVGISDSDLYLVAQDPAKVAKSLDQMKALGVNDVRIVIPWGTTETSDGQYNWSSIDNMVNAARARGMTILGVVTTTPAWARPTTWFGDYYAPPANISDYGDFMSVLAKRYSGQVASYEVWNEPNAGSAFGPKPNAALYTQMLKAGYTAVKAADKNASVIGGVVGSVISWGDFTLNPVDFVTQMYAAGAAGYFDALSFHPYQYTTPFSQGANLWQSPLNQLDAIRALMVGNGDAAKKIWATEYGLPTGTINPSMPVAEAQQASYIKDFLDAWNSLSYAGKAYLYTTVDRSSSNTTDGEATFGLYRDDWTLKPAAQVVKDWIAAHPTTPPVVTPPVVTPPANPVDALAAALSAALQQWLQALAAAFAAAFAPPTATVAAAPATTVAAASANTVAIASTTTPTTTATSSSSTPSSSTAPAGTTPSSTTVAVSPSTVATTAQKAAVSPTTTATTTSAPPATSSKNPAPSTTSSVTGTTTTAPATTPSTTTPSTSATSTAPKSTATTTPSSTSGKVATTTPAP